MICDVVRAWLLTAREEALPDEVAFHLEECPRCHRFHKRLRQSDHLAGSVAPHPVASAQVAALVQSLPEQSPLRPAADPGAASAAAASGPRPYSWTLLTALLSLGFALGLGSGLFLTTPPALPGRTDEPDLAQLAEVHVRLADTDAAVEQVRLLELLAGHLRSDALKLARAGEIDHLPLLTQLHEHVLEQGVLRRTLLLPPAERERIRERMLGDLPRLRQALQVETVGIAAQHRSLIEPLAEAVEVLAEHLRSGEPIPPSPRTSRFVSGTTHDLLVGLVSSSLEIVEESDPRHRAQASSALAERLALAAHLARVGGQPDQAAQYETALGLILSAALEPNLERARRADPNNPQLAELAAALLRLRPQKPHFKHGPEHALPKHNEKEPHEHREGKGKGKGHPADKK